MSIFVIGDENTVLGFSLVGVDGSQVENLKELNSRLEEALQREEIEIVLVTEYWAAQLGDEFDRLKMESEKPLVLEIPGSQPAPSRQSLMELVQQAVGIPLSIGSGR